MKGENRSPIQVGIFWIEAWLGEGKDRRARAVRPSLSFSVVSAASAASPNQTRSISIFGLLIFSSPCRTDVDQYGVDIKDLVYAGDG